MNEEEQRLHEDLDKLIGYLKDDCFDNDDKLVFLTQATQILAKLMTLL